jgi:hypothetical protein
MSDTSTTTIDTAVQLHQSSRIRADTGKSSRVPIYTEMPAGAGPGSVSFFSRDLTHYRDCMAQVGAAQDHWQHNPHVVIFSHMEQRSYLGAKKLL